MELPSGAELSALVHFGKIVERIGQAMVREGMLSASADQIASLDRAIELLEGVVGLLAAYGMADEAAADPGESSVQ